MELHSPFSISARLLPCLRIGTVDLQLQYVRTTGEGRAVYRWTIDGIGRKSYSGEDLKSGCQGCTLQEMFGSFLSFLGAAAESYRYRGKNGENADLFPLAVSKWAAQNSDEISMLGMEVEETDAELITE